MIKASVKWALRPLWNRLGARIDGRIREALAVHAELQRDERADADRDFKAGPSQLWMPPCPPLWQSSMPFMAYSTCSASDFMQAPYLEYCEMLRHAPVYHRKLWEWIFVVHHLRQAGMLAEGRRGLGFGVGTERLPAFFASLGAQVVATDAPPEIGEARGWKEGNQHSDVIEQLHYPQIVEREAFLRLVSHRPCDMNDIPPELSGFDFTWSCCSLEHLGSLEAGMQFFINSVERTLKVGGVACHTTEFNLSSNEDTLSEGGTVIYRQRDMLELVERLRARGHQVQPFSVAPDSHYMDGFVDAPPYSNNPHLKLLLAGYVATSVGLVVVRGR